MSVYHQLGHQSENLIFEEALASYKGAILSPVNSTQTGVARTISSVRENFDEYDLVFDPQLYYPRTERNVLRSWSYFPNDVDTVDLTNFGWWQNLNLSLSRTVREIGPNAVCTPVPHPKSYDNNYYDLMNRVTDDLCNSLNGSGIRVLQTAFVSLSELANYERVMSIASILTRTSADGIYLVFYTNTNPRRELDVPEELKGGTLLIHILESNDIRVLVGYTSTDLLLWKESGATTCATGKFFNLRRFTPSRWEESDEGGGGQLPYLIEENLVAYLRESDVARVDRNGVISNVSHSNPFYQEIQGHMTTGAAWVAIGWRFYLYWFYDIENRINQNVVKPINLLKAADENWGRVDDNNIILEERHNNGNWIRQWLRAIVEYKEAW